MARSRTLTLNRPNELNVLDEAMVEALVAHTTALAADDSLRVVVLRGAGKHFMAGGDIRSFAARIGEAPAVRTEAFLRLIGRLHAAIEHLHRMPHPVVGCVHGAVAGFGLSLMNACDLVVAADSAYFASAYRQIGLTPDGGGSWSLPRLVGMRKAMEIFLLGERFGAAEALALGIVNRVVPAAELDTATRAIVDALATGPVQALRNAKRLVRESLGRTLAEQLDAEAASFCGLRGNARFRRGHHRVPRQAAAALRLKPPRNRSGIRCHAFTARHSSSPADRAASASPSRSARRAKAPTSPSPRRPSSRIRSCPGPFIPPRRRSSGRAAARCRSPATSATRPRWPPPSRRQRASSAASTSSSTTRARSA